MQIKYRSLSLIIIAFLSVLIHTTGCKKVEITPEGFVEIDEAIKNEADVKAILNATYTPLRGDKFFGGRQQIISELMADMVYGADLTGGYSSLYTFSSGNNNGTANDFYAEAYLIIQRANVALDNLAKVTSSDAARKDVEGQAKFIRALAHFELVKLYAQPFGFTAQNSHPGIIIKTTSQMESGNTRSTVQQVYDQIISDLKSAENSLPPTNGNYPGSLAAKAMLARVYFQMNNYGEAYNYSNQVINSNQFQFDNTADYVTRRFGVPKTSEAIFWLVNEPGVTSMSGLRNEGTNIQMSLGLPITKEVYDEAKANPADVRFSAWYKDSLNTTTNTHTYSVRKYAKSEFILPVIHLTEMKLTRAESAAELNQNLGVAIADINDITSRAYGGAVAPLTSSATAAVIKARVRAERKKEMIFEVGDRLQQIKRIGAKGEASVSRSAPWNCNGMILLFPVNEIKVNNNIIQNPTGGCN